MSLWEIDICHRAGQPDLAGMAVAADAVELQLAEDFEVTSARGFLVEGDFTEDQANRLARELFSDAVVETTVVAPVGSPVLAHVPPGSPNGLPSSRRLVHVLPKPGVTDPVAQSAMEAIKDFGIAVQAVRTLRKYCLTGLSDDGLQAYCRRIHANDAIEQVVVGPLQIERLDIGSKRKFAVQRVPIRELGDLALKQLSREGQLYLTLVEMQTIQRHFVDLQREPTDAELETIAQTWSEHCSHKTLAGRIAYRDEQGDRQFENMLKETIFAATQEIRRRLGEEDWCVSVFEDNAGVVRFDDQYNVVFKVETHNHPSALEP